MYVVVLTASWTGACTIRFVSYIYGCIEILYKSVHGSVCFLLYIASHVFNFLVAVWRNNMGGGHILHRLVNVFVITNLIHKLIHQLDTQIHCSMYKSSWGWTLGCSKHVEDTIIKLKLCKKCAYFFILLHRYITMHGPKNVNSTQFCLVVRFRYRYRYGNASKYAMLYFRWLG